MLETKSLERIRYQSLAEAVGQRIREAIVTGQFHPGDRLVEQRLARALGTSQPTVREALKELEYEGFVKKSPNKGTYVTSLNEEDIRKILEVRLRLEALAVECAVRNLDAQGVSELQGYVLQMERAVREDDRLMFHGADLAFHSRLWQLAGNEYLEAILKRLVFALFAFVLSTQNKSTFKDAVKQHKQIFAGLTSGKTAEALGAFLSGTVGFWEKYYHVSFPG